MALIKYTISSILGGKSPIFHGGGEGQFSESLGIDPESAYLNMPTGSIVPIAYTDFTSGVPSGAPMWLETDPVLFKLWAYGDDGEFYRYDGASFLNETLIGTPTSGAGNGMAYYNNYIYLATPTDISRYGPLNSSPAIVNTYWTGATTAGLNQTALVDTTYPATRNVSYPNHPMHVHSDGFLYFGDFDSTSSTPATRGKGLIHRIGTKYGTAGAITNEGSADNGSAYNVLDLPIDVMPFAIESYGTYLAILGTQSPVGSTTITGQSWLYLWDGTSDSYDKEIPIPISRATAMKNVNGKLRIFGGSQDFGYQIFEYIGGDEVTPLRSFQTGSPPFQGAVDIEGNRMVWGAFSASNGVGTTGDAAYVMAYGYQNAGLGPDTIHNLGAVDTLNTLPVISSLKYVQQQQQAKKPIIGWRTDTSADYGISNVTTTTNNSVLRSEVFSVDTSFKVRELRIPLTATTGAGLAITPKIWFDDATTSKTLTVISNTNYPSARKVSYNPLEIEQASSAGYVGRNNFFLELAFTGTSAIGAELPIEIIVETLDD